MADIDVERKGPSIWPWIIGLLVLALLIWAVAEMVDTEEPEIAAVDTQVAEEIQPAEDPALMEPTQPAAQLETLMPLAAEDAGRQVRLSGTVVGEPTSEGFFVRTANDQIIFVNGDRQVQSGESVRITGTLNERAEVETNGGTMQEAGFDAEPNWTVHEGWVIDASNVMVQPAAGQMAPAGDAPAEEEPVTGRY